MNHLRLFHMLLLLNIIFSACACGDVYRHVTFSGHVYVKTITILFKGLLFIFPIQKYQQKMNQPAVLTVMGFTKQDVLSIVARKSVSMRTTPNINPHVSLKQLLPVSRLLRTTKHTRFVAALEHVPKLVEIYSGYPIFMFGLTINQRSNHYEFEERMFKEHGEVKIKRITEAFCDVRPYCLSRRFA